MTYTEKARTPPVAGTFDVIVAGSGPAGIGAAVAAGRMGARVLLLESAGRVGGISTSGLMSHFTGTVGNQLYWEILRRAAEKNPFDREPYQVAIDPELLTLTYLEMLEEAGVTLRLYTFVSDVIMEENRACGVICESKGGREAFLADVVVDATGDGDVAWRAGAAFCLGREEDHRMQPATLMFKVAGVDMAQAVFPGSFETLVPTEKGELQALAKKLLPPPAGHVLLYRSPIPGVVTCNMTNVIGIDGTDAADLTRAELECRRQLLPIVQFLRDYVPGYAHCYLLETASLIGVRETRHFAGVQTLTEQDILEARQFPDWVVYGAHFNFDVHNLTGSGLDVTGCQHHFTQQNGYTIPYGCLVPQTVDGLLLSGRNLSGTHMAHSNFRVMPICIGSGWAAGTAAALAARQGIRSRDVNPAEIQAQEPR